MTFKVYFLVVRTPDGIYDAYPIGEDGRYEEIAVEYSPDYVTKEDLVKYAEKIYGDRGPNILSRQIKLLEQGMCFTMQSEARHLPSLGEMELSFEESRATLM